MSASREKRTRQDQTSQGASEKKPRQRGQEQKDRSGILYAVVGVIIAAVIIALLVYNSNFFQNRATAVSINGQSYNSADVQYYYSGLRNYYSMMGIYNYSVSAKDQMYSQADNKTWHDFFLEQAVDNLTQDVALAAEAEKAAFTLSAEGQADIDSTLSSLETNWISSGYGSRDAYLRANYGTSMTYDKFVSILTRSALASEYANAQASSYTYDDAELNAYYAEHKDELDSFVLTQFVFQASVPTQTDSDGNAVELTAEEKAAALEEAKQEAKAKADALQARLEAGENVEKLQEEYTDDLFSSYISETRSGSSVNSEYADWAYDSARKSGDVTAVEYQGGSDTTYNYCVVRFEDRYQDNDPTANVRHILVSAGSAPTEEEYAEAKTKAEELLAQWEADGATEDAFAQLATENSADTSSAANGGLISNVSKSSSYVDTFKEWSLDSSRKEGDTGIVQNTGSSVKGYHVMYFSSWGDPQWMLNVESTLRSQDYNTWLDGILANYTAENGSGLNYVG